MTMTNTYRGELFQSGYNSNEKINAMSSIGNVSELKIKINTEKVSMVNFMNGQDSTDEQFLRITGGSVSITAEEASRANLALAFGGNIVRDDPETVTGAMLYAYNQNTKKWKVKDDSAALVVNQKYQLARSISNDSLSVEPYYGIDETTLTVYDSSTTPKELESGVDYEFNPNTGKIWLLESSGHGIHLPGITYPIMCNFEVGKFTDTLPNELTPDIWYPLSFADLSDVVIKDSSSTPKTIQASYYAVDADYGMVKFSDLTSINAISGITFPLIVTATRGRTTGFGLGVNNVVEKTLRLNGIEIRNNRKVIIVLYRVQFDLSEISFFDKDWAKVPLSGDILADTSKPSDNVLGQFGKMVFLQN